MYFRIIEVGYKGYIMFVKCVLQASVYVLNVQPVIDFLDSNLKVNTPSCLYKVVFSLVKTPHTLPKIKDLNPRMTMVKTM